MKMIFDPAWVVRFGGVLLTTGFTRGYQYATLTGLERKNDLSIEWNIKPDRFLKSVRFFLCWYGHFDRLNDGGSVTAIPLQLRPIAVEILFILLFQKNKKIGT